MVLYRMTAPNGVTYELDGPPGATAQDVTAQILARVPTAGSPPAAPAEQSGGVPRGSEFSRSAAGAWESAKRLSTQYAAQNDAKALGEGVGDLYLMDQIDSGKTVAPEDENWFLKMGRAFASTLGNDPEAMAQYGEKTASARALKDYQSATPKERLAMRAPLERQNKKLNPTVQAALADEAKFKKEQEKNATIGLSDAHTAGDYVDWAQGILGQTAVAGGLSGLAAIVAPRGVKRLAAAGTSAALTAGDIQRTRLQRIVEQTTGLPPEEQARVVADYMVKSGDTTMITALMVGGLDVVMGGPLSDLVVKLIPKKVAASAAADIALKTGTKAVSQQTALQAAGAGLKRAPVNTGVEALTGGAQETVQLLGEEVLGENGDDPLFSMKNLARIAEASVGEAVGGLGGAAVNTGLSTAGTALQNRRIRAINAQQSLDSGIDPKATAEGAKRYFEILQEVKAKNNALSFDDQSKLALQQFEQERANAPAKPGGDAAGVPRAGRKAGPGKATPDAGGAGGPGVGGTGEDAGALPVGEAAGAAPVAGKLSFAAANNAVQAVIDAGLDNRTVSKAKRDAAVVKLMNGEVVTAEEALQSVGVPIAPQAPPPAPSPTPSVPPAAAAGVPPLTPTPPVAPAVVPGPPESAPPVEAASASVAPPEAPPPAPVAPPAAQEVSEAAPPPTTEAVAPLGNAVTEALAAQDRTVAEGIVKPKKAAPPVDVSEALTPEAVAVPDTPEAKYEALLAADAERDEIGDSPERAPLARSGTVDYTGKKKTANSWGIPLNDGTEVTLVRDPDSKLWSVFDPLTGVTDPLVKLKDGERVGIPDVRTARNHVAQRVAASRVKWMNAHVGEERHAVDVTYEEGVAQRQPSAGRSITALNKGRSRQGEAAIDPWMNPQSDLLVDVDAARRTGEITDADQAAILRAVSPELANPTPPALPSQRELWNAYRKVDKLRTEIAALKAKKQPDGKKNSAEITAKNKELEAAVATLSDGMETLTVHARNLFEVRKAAPAARRAEVVRAQKWVREAIAAGRITEGQGRHFLREYNAPIEDAPAPVKPSPEAAAETYLKGVASRAAPAIAAEKREAPPTRDELRAKVKANLEARVTDKEITQARADELLSKFDKTAYLAEGDLGGAQTELAQQLVAVAKEAGNIHAVLSRMVDEGGLLGQAAERLLAVLPNTKVKVVSQEMLRSMSDRLTGVPKDEQPTRGPDGRWVYPERRVLEGLYDPASDTIYLHEDMSYDHVPLHEAIHPVIIGHIKSGTPEGKALEALYKSFKDRAPGSDKYGLVSVDEFVSEILSNEGFREYLRTLPSVVGGERAARPTSMLGKFKGILTRVIDKLFRRPSVAPAQQRTSAALVNEAFEQTMQLTESAAADPRKATGAPRAAMSTKKKNEWSHTGAVNLTERALNGGSPNFMRNLLKTSIAVGNRKLRRNTLGAYWTDGIVSVCRNYSPIVAGKLATVAKAFTDMTALRLHSYAHIERTGKLWQKFATKHPGVNRLLSDVLHYATLQNINPGLYSSYADMEANDPKLVELIQRNKANMAAQNKRKAALREIWDMWEMLGTEANGHGQKLFTRVTNDYKQDFERKYQLAIRNLKALQMPAAKEAEAIKSIDELFAKARKTGLYVPLVRQGDWWASVGTGSDKVTKAFASETARDMGLQDMVDKVNEDRVPGTPVRTLEEMRVANEVTTSYRPGDINNMLLQDDAAGVLQKVMSKLEAAKSPSASTVVDMVFQMYLSALPEGSSAKRMMHRKGTAGYSGDALTNYVATRTSAANQYARLSHAHDIQMALSEANAALSGRPDSEKIKPFIEEMTKRASMELSPKPVEGFWNTAVIGLNRLAFYKFLVQGKALITQMTQLPLVGLPVLIAEYGPAAATLIAARYTATLPFTKLGISSVQEDLDGNMVTEWGAPSMGKGRNAKAQTGLGEALRYAYDEVEHAGLFGSTLTASLTERAQTSTSLSTNKVLRAGNAVDNFLSGGIHYGERISRDLMFGAVVELEYKKQMAGGATQAEAQERATEKAINLVNEAMFDYSTSNKPRWARSVPGRLAMQFTSFPMHMTAFLVRNFTGMYRNLNTAEEKRAAATKFFGTLGMAYMFGGAIAMPMYDTFWSMANLMRDMFRDDDDDDDTTDDGNPMGKVDLKLWFEEYFIPEHFGNGMLAKAVKMGPISALTDLNIGASTSLNNMFFRDTPRESGKLGQDVLAGLVKTGLGAGVAAAVEVLDGIGMFAMGDVQRGLEKAMPIGVLRSGLAAYRLGKEGARTPKDAALYDEAGDVGSKEFYNAPRLIAQAAGYASTSVNEIQRRNALVKNMFRGLVDEKNTVLEDVNRAWATYQKNPNDDTEAAAYKSFELVDAFNRVNPFPSIAIDDDTVDASVEGKWEAREEASMYEGYMGDEDEAAIAGMFQAEK